jgi:hypothetical protein
MNVQFFCTPVKEDAGNRLGSFETRHQAPTTFPAGN